MLRKKYSSPHDLRSYNMMVRGLSLLQVVFLIFVSCPSFQARLESTIDGDIWTRRASTMHGRRELSNHMHCSDISVSPDGTTAGATCLNIQSLPPHYNEGPGPQVDLRACNYTCASCYVIDNSLTLPNRAGDYVEYAGKHESALCIGRSENDGGAYWDFTPMCVPDSDESACEHSSNIESCSSGDAGPAPSSEEEYLVWCDTIRMDDSCNPYFSSEMCEFLWDRMGQGSLDLSRVGFSLRYIPANMFDGYHASVTKMYINYQYLEYFYSPWIEEGAFSNLAQLTELEVTGNYIQNLSSAFQNLTSMEQITLSSNQITSIAANAFQGSISVQDLIMDGNRITSVSANAFAGLIELRTIELHNNLLETIVANTFFIADDDDANEIHMLHLQNNQISLIEENAFAGLTKLSELDLSYNAISDLQDGTFDGLTSLVRFSLASNDIRVLSQGFFHGARLSGESGALDLTFNVR